MFGRIRQATQRFLYGRNGFDRFSLVLLIAAGSCMLLSRLLSGFYWRSGSGILINPVCLTLYFGSLGLLGWCVFRILSRNVAARQRENRSFNLLWRRLTDWKHRYYYCPNCHQLVRVPKGRGKVCIKCPKCAEKFVRKS